MKIFPKPLLNKVWTEKICLLHQQIINCAIRAQRFSCDAQSGICLYGGKPFPINIHS